MASTKYGVYADPVTPIGCHAWNKTRDRLAVSPNNHLVQIMKLEGSKWVVEATLDGHTSRVTGIDWAPESNQIVTCGADRNAYVWKFESGQWNPALVILRINRAATCVKWSPDEKKFAVGSGSRLVSVCFFEEENDWWVSKHIKKPLRSTVLCLDWHPNSILLGVGSTDFTARVFSAYIKDIEAKPGPTSWGKKMPFGACLAEFTNGPVGGGWVHSVGFSPEGDRLAYASHDSSVSVGMGDGTVHRADLGDLPYRSLVWITPEHFVAGGYSNLPVLFGHSPAGIVQRGPLDVPEKKMARKMSAMDKFRSLDSKGTSDAGKTKTSIDTVHQNSISEIRIHTGTAESGALTFSSVGEDGACVIWDIGKLRSGPAFSA